MSEETYLAYELLDEAASLMLVEGKAHEAAALAFTAVQRILALTDGVLAIKDGRLTTIPFDQC